LQEVIFSKRVLLLLWGEVFPLNLDIPSELNDLFREFDRPQIVILALQRRAIVLRRELILVWFVLRGDEYSGCELRTLIE